MSNESYGEIAQDTFSDFIGFTTRQVFSIMI